ncbi:glycosyltransferase [Paenibacillus sp. P25]|nr:glycosyltransferase [Paenibacillus sp. P25]
MTPLPTRKKVAAIVCVMNESHAIGKVLDELDRLPLHEIIVVINGSTDPSFDRVRAHPAAPVIIHYDEPLGHDVGRSIGAKASQSDILLFLDGDTPVSYRKLLSFIRAIDKGADVALNDISPFIHRFHRRDSVSVIKEFVNRAMGRSDLMANSMTAVPHALSRAAVEAIGIENLSVPPLAQTIALSKRLKVTAPASVNVVRISSITRAHSPVTELVIGDHLEALHEAMRLGGTRLRFKDHMRKRHLAGG